MSFDKMIKNLFKKLETKNFSTEAEKAEAYADLSRLLVRNGLYGAVGTQEGLRLLRANRERASTQEPSPALEESFADYSTRICRERLERG